MMPCRMMAMFQMFLAVTAFVTCSIVTARGAPASEGVQEESYTAPGNGQDLYGRMADLIVPYGYPLQEHFTTTVDGYILRMFRIPYSPKRKDSDVPGPVVHLQHGLLGSSTDYCLNGPGLSLPFILSDAGFDVWLGNVRGNTYSKNHTHLDLLDSRFWSFSWDDMAAKDLPAMLLHELRTTGAQSMGYVGHSQGTTIGMAMFSSHPAVADLINVAVLLAPVAYVTHVDSLPLVTLAQLNTAQIFTLLGFHEFLPSVELLSKLEGQLCQLRPELCVNLLAAICGYNPDNLDVSRLPIYLNYTPSGTSVQNMAHWTQAVSSLNPQGMSYYDYGTQCKTLLDLPRPCNQKVYGQEEAPQYNLSSISTPLALYTGGQDKLSDPMDIELLLKVLPHRLLWEWHDEPAYEHLDFIWGTNAKDLIYRNVLQMLQKGQERRSHKEASTLLRGRAPTNSPHQEQQRTSIFSKWTSLFSV